MSEPARPPDQQLVSVGMHECVTCERCATTFAAVHPACPRCASRPPDQQLVSRFVDGIGPPLSQIREDYMALLPELSARDVISLIDAYEALSRRVEELEAENRDFRDEIVREHNALCAAEREANTLKDALAEALDYLEEYRDVLARERGGGTPLDRMGYILLHRQGKEVLERLKPLAARETEVVFTPESWDRIDRLAEQDDSVSARPKEDTPDD